MLKLYTDYRLGGEPRYYLAKQPEHLMRVPDPVPKCVVFLCIKAIQDEKEIYLPGGTAFFVSMKPVPDITFGYLFTVKHVLEDMGLDKRSIDKKIYIRYNKINGEVDTLETSVGDWYTNEVEHGMDSAVDVAVFPLLPHLKIFDHAAFPIRYIVTEKSAKTENIGIGDEVFVSGLFNRRYGNDRNIPIIRTGNIAAMLDEKIKTRYGKTDMYLIECRSIGGLSGSPVFVHKPKLKIVADRNRIGALTNLTLDFEDEWFRLLGLIHGHWDVDMKRVALQPDLMLKDVAEFLNMGIALVTPMERAIEVLDHPELKKQREDEIKRIQDDNVPSTDSAIYSTEESTENDFTEADFENALRKVSRPNKPDDKNSRKKGRKAG
jgi:hypothetical protein